MFDHLVIGKGLMGSAALRYLSRATPNVAMVGPDEPKDWATHDGVFASHYDEGRLAYVVSRDLVWSQLTAASIEQYPVIEREGGVKFHYPVGSIRVARTPGGGRVGAAGFDYADIGEKLGVRLGVLPDAAAINARFPFLSFPDGYAAVYEGAPAGWINPRALVRAQVAAAVSRGATVMSDIAVRVNRDGDGLAVTTRGGDTLRARQVLVAAGAYTNSQDLLPRKLAIRIKGEMTVLARLNVVEAAKLSAMPVVGYAVESPRIDGIYMTPPTRYPDGHVYLKMGCDTSTDEILADADAMRRWVVEGNGDAGADAMADAIRAMFPDVRFEAFVVKRCIVCYSPHRKPYVDQPDDRLFVCAVGNGAGAKPSDTLGELGARLMLGQPWPSEFDRTTFRAIYADAGEERDLFRPYPHISPAVRIG